MNIEIPVAPGESIDKITIVAIKRSRISDPEKLAHVEREFQELMEVFDTRIKPDESLLQLQEALRAVNEEIWIVEDDIRDCERRKDFGSVFVELARQVYFKNDRRAALKREINICLASPIVEEKSYSPYA